ncbi:MAG: hypothetical protein J6S40_00220 [Thermoguttaceae bacterium]|nr:hypothetical protein [Thermoguttaceae bacterium]
MKTIEDLDQGTIRRIDWQELVPGVLFFRALTQAFRVGPIAVGTILVLLLMVLTGRSPATADFSVLLFKSLVCPFCCHAGPVTLGFVAFALAAAFLWLFLARRGAMRLVTTERVSLGKGLKFARSRYVSLLLAISIPLLGLLAAVALIGTAERSFWFFTHGTPILLGIVWLLLLIGVGFLIGLPMLAAAVAVDNCDGFDAFSRVFAYIFQRPFHTLFYLAVAVLFGAVGFFILKGGVFALVKVVDAFNLSGSDTDVLISDNLWSLSWWAATAMIPHGFVFGYTCYAGVALYLLLRKTLDGIAFDVIHSDSTEPIHRLRPILQESEGGAEFASGSPEGTSKTAEPAENETPSEEPTERA